MLVLAVDTATPGPALALAGESFEEDIPLPPGHQASEVLLPSLKELLERRGLSIDRVKRLAVLSGPGSFTGIRVGLATVWALSRSRGIPVESMGSLEAVAETARGRGVARVRARFDAERGEIYTATYDLTGARAAVIAPPALARPEAPEDESELTVDAARRLSPSAALAAARAIARSPGEPAAALHATYVQLSAAEERRGRDSS